MKVFKVGQISNGWLTLCKQSQSQQATILGILTNLEEVKDPKPGSSWKVSIELDGSEDQQRLVTLTLPPLIRNSDPSDTPFFVRHPSVVFFRDRLFTLEYEPRSPEEHEEVILRVKKAVYDEATELSALRAAVANLEAAMAYEKSGPRREPIPEDVKLLVWARDGGACTKCGSKKDLHFDHIIPFSKGGGNSELNIQLLCQVCNLRKSDKIALPR